MPKTFPTTTYFPKVSRSAFTKKLPLLLLFSLFSYFLKGQTYDWHSVVTVGTNSRYEDMALDSQGNVIVSGRFRSYAYFLGTTTTDSITGTSDVASFIQKVDSSGANLWMLNLQSATGSVTESKVAVDDSNNIYVWGTFEGTFDFDQGSGTHNLVSYGLTDQFLLKLDENGGFKWVVQFDNVSGAFPQSIKVEDGYGIYISGTYLGNYDMDPGTGTDVASSKGGYDVFVIRLDFNGNYSWGKTYGGVADITVRDLVVDSLGRVYLSGDFIDSVDFNPGNQVHMEWGGYSSQFAYLLKLGNAGQFAWVKTIGKTSGNPTFGYHIAIGPKGSVYWSGKCDGSQIDLNPNSGTYYPPASNNRANFIMKLHPNGTFYWAQRITTPSYVNTKGLALDSEGMIFLFGDMGNNTNFDPDNGGYVLTFSPNGPPHFQNYIYGQFIAKFSPTGRFKKVNFLESEQSFFSSDICISPNRDLYTSGRFSDKVVFDKVANTYVNASNDLHIQKHTQCFVESDTVSITACDSIRWIDNVLYTDTFAQGKMYFVNSNGCDSVLYLDANFIAPDDSVIVSGATLTAYESNAVSYQWYKCEWGNKVLLQGETNRAYTAQVNGYYSVEIESPSCTTNTSCVGIFSVGMDEWEKGFIQIFPNPTRQWITLESNEPIHKAEVTITTLAGKRIFHQEYDELQSTSLELPGPKGVYLVFVKGVESTYTQKVIKN